MFSNIGKSGADIKPIEIPQQPQGGVNSKELNKLKELCSRIPSIEDSLEEIIK
jgi:hypothetical protein